MSMSTSVYGMRDLTDDGQFQKMIKVKLACEDADIDYPEVLEDYFSTCGPDADVDQQMREMGEVCIDEAVSEVRYDMTEGYEVDVTKLPDGITKIRFTNSY